ncbi:MAG: amidohydrolase family protein [Phycisphaerales bacterium]|nr:MAG: amidohydrolase family protein [Phycisphaerales bacterium]
MTDLEHHIRQTPLADTHEHISSAAEVADKSPDVLQTLFGGTYITADLVVAGADPQAVERLVDSSDHDVRGRFNAISDAWQHCQHTGYGEGLRLAAKLVYGMEEISAEAVETARARDAELWQPRARLRLLREMANIEYVQIDDATWPCKADPEAPEFFLSDISWVSFVNGQIDAEAIHAEVGVDVYDLESLREAMTGIFAKHAPCAIGVKSPHAYTRTLRWKDRSDADVEGVLQRQLAGHELTDDDRLCLGDWCWARGIELATQHNLPFKHHTGYCAGHSEMVLERTRPAHLCPLLVKYPQAQFVLMHCGYPYGGELLALAKHFPNVFIDLCWAWSIDPFNLCDFVRRWIHTAPVNKLFAFGGDACWAAQSVGYAAQCRRWLTRALQAEVDERLLSEKQAMELATLVMRENQRDVFDLEGTRAALHASMKEAS